VVFPHDVGVTRVPGRVGRHVGDDPVQRHGLRVRPPPRDPARRVERQSEPAGAGGEKRLRQWAGVDDDLGMTY
jgi:hypothetical protein